MAEQREGGKEKESKTNNKREERRDECS